VGCGRDNSEIGGDHRRALVDEDDPAWVEQTDMTFDRVL
jgi:hypothetical protein